MIVHGRSCSANGRVGSANACGNQPCARTRAWRAWVTWRMPHMQLGAQVRTFRVMVMETNHHGAGSLGLLPMTKSIKNFSTTLEMVAANATQGSAKAAKRAL